MKNKNTFDSFIKKKILTLESLKKISSENKKNKKKITSFTVKQIKEYLNKLD